MRAPRVTAIALRFVGTIRREILDRTLLINHWHAATALREYQHHYLLHEAPLDHVEVKELRQQALAAAR